MSVRRRARTRPPSSAGAAAFSSDAPVLVDFESRSRAKLKSVGGRNYWLDPSSEAICAVLYDTQTGEVATWGPGDPAPNLALAVAHNAVMFDRFAAERYGWHVGEWRDSSHAARRAGYPGALDVLALRRLGRHKDKAGNKFTVGLSTQSRAKAIKGQLPELSDPVVERVTAYCADDVEVMAETWPWLSAWLDVDDATAKADQAINDRGIKLDVDLVHVLQKLVIRKQGEAVAEQAERLGWTPEQTRKVARSVPQFREATGLPNAQAETLAKYVAAREAKGKRVHPLVLVRQALASIIPGKLKAALARVSPDGRLRDTHLYCGAHTWRWSSKGVQLHNLTRVEVHGGGDMVLRLVDEVMRRGDVRERLLLEAFPDARKDRHALLFAALIRAALTASDGNLLAVLDYSGIEARATAWAARDWKALDVFKAYDAGKGQDPYKVMAGKIWSVDPASIEKPQRQVGKAAELGCGYGMGPPKFDATCKKQGTDLSAAGVDAEDVVGAWRELHAPIVQLWRDCEKAFVAACEGREAYAGPFLYAPIGDDVACMLPSGRPIMYPNAAIRRVTRQGKRGPFQAWDMTYQGHRFREHVYGGLFVENAIQGFCRDLLADAMVRAERDGLDPVLHVHDELACDVPRALGTEALEYMREIMSTPPEWAAGLPIKLDGFAEERYRK